VCIAGALPGPAVARFVGWLLDIHWEQVFKRPEMLPAFARLDGACQVLCCYVFGILPLEYFRPRLRKYPRLVTYAAALGGAIFGAATGSWLATGKVNELLGGARALRGSPAMVRAFMQQQHLRIVALSFALTILCVLLMILVRTVVAEAEIREYALAEAAALAKAHALQSQINPHFFFNTLTTISALADMDSRAAKELVGQLAQLFRYTLSCSRCEMVTLAEELEFVRNYLSIEQARYRLRLQFEMPPPETGTDLLLPGLTLQPVVENAVRHGIARMREGGTIKIGAERVMAAGAAPENSGRGPVWVISVANQVAFAEEAPALDPEIVFQPGHSLANTRDRLALAFRGRAKLEFLRDGTEWVKVALTLPAGPEAL
jgi:hypothetical protein